MKFKNIVSVKTPDLERGNSEDSLSHTTINAVDKSGLYKIYEQWPMHAVDAWKKKFRLPEFDVDEVIFAGMGASGIIGEVISDWLYLRSDYRFKAIHQHTLPKRKDSSSAIICR